MAKKYVPKDIEYLTPGKVRIHFEMRLPMYRKGRKKPVHTIKQGFVAQGPNATAAWNAAISMFQQCTDKLKSLVRDH